MDVRELAALMGRPVAEVATFVACLATFTHRGQSVEQAIESVSDVWTVLLNKVADAMADGYSVHTLGVNALVDSLAGQVWDAVNAPEVA
jgi:hypothetical protein